MEISITNWNPNKSPIISLRYIPTFSEAPGDIEKFSGRFAEIFYFFTVRSYKNVIFQEAR